MATNKHGSHAGKVAFVTGAASGIGRATALAFAREGASVVVSDISEQNVRDTARRIEELGAGDCVGRGTVRSSVGTPPTTASVTTPPATTT